MSADATAIGNVLLAAGKPEEALQQYNHALELQEGSDLSQEVSDLSQEVKENARLVHHYNLGRVAVKSKDLAGAKQRADAFMQGATAKKNDAQTRLAHELAGLIALKEKQYDRALAHVGKANQQDPYVLYLTGLAYQGKGNEGKAAEMFRNAANHNTLPTLNYAFVRAKAKKMKAGPSHSTASPTAISPPSRTSANTPPPQSSFIAVRNPGRASSIRSQGLVSPPMRTRHDPIRMTRSRLRASAMPPTRRFARRAEGDTEAPNCRIRSSQTSCSMIVTCRRRP